MSMTVTQKLIEDLEFAVSNWCLVTNTTPVTDQEKWTQSLKRLHDARISLMIAVRNTEKLASYGASLVKVLGEPDFTRCNGPCCDATIAQILGCEGNTCGELDVKLKEVAAFKVELNK